MAKDYVEERDGGYYVAGTRVSEELAQDGRDARLAAQALTSSYAVWRRAVAPFALWIRLWNASTKGFPPRRSSKNLKH